MVLRSMSVNVVIKSCEEASIVHFRSQVRS
jgi:hypothetical protein